MRKNLAKVSTFFLLQLPGRLIREGGEVLSPAPLRPLRQAQGRQAQGSLEPSEASEKKILADVLGSLKEPCKAGVPMGPSGLMERS